MMEYTVDDAYELAGRVFDSLSNAELQEMFIHLAVEEYIANPHAFERDRRLHGPDGGET
jgi:hypothetical protein